MENHLKITVAGAGYVGLANAVLLAQKYPVCLYDVDAARVDAINKGVSPLADAGIEEALATKTLQLTATTNPNEAFTHANYVIIATPTNFDEEANCFDTASVEEVASQVISISPQAIKVIRSTMPIGFTQKLMEALGDDKFITMPEFLREGRALEDSLYPSRIVVGVAKNNCPVYKNAKAFTACMLECIRKDMGEIPPLYMEPSEAEAVKLYSNAYLASRVAFFNEVDTFAAMKGLDPKNIIDGVSADPRIGSDYNNPSFGYGGYCLPKDTKLLSATHEQVPSALISAIVTANATRKSFVAEEILKKNPQTVGIYRLTMKTDSDNFRYSAVLDIIEQLKEAGVTVVVYEPTLLDDTFNGCEVVRDLQEFMNVSSVICANRYNRELDDVIQKVYTRDIYHKN